MKNAIRVYRLLLKLYPSSYRDAFGEQMLQTFADHYTDLEASESRAGMLFWPSLIADELRNVVRQHVDELADGSGPLKVTRGRIALAAVLVPPLYAVFWALAVELALAVPHPPVSGPFALVAIATVALVLPGVSSLAVSYLLANALVSTFSRRKRDA